MDGFIDDLDTYEPTTPVERAVAYRLGIDVSYVRLMLDTFEEEFDRIDDLQRARDRNGRALGD